MQASALPTGTKWVDLRAIRRPILLLEKEGSGQSLFGESPTEKEMSELQKKVDVSSRDPLGASGIKPSPTHAAPGATWVAEKGRDYLKSLSQARGLP